MSFVITSATPADTVAVEDLMTQLAEFSSGAPDDGVATRFAYLLNSPSHAVFVARDSQAATIGLLVASQRMTLWHAGPCALIEELVVDQEWRGKGVGKTLIRAAMDWAINLGCNELEISTDCENVQAQALYRKMGFDHQAVLLEHEFER
jgi:GNAT superfamily N-acetyltransferase